MTENLNVDRFRHGEPIPHALTAEEWSAAGEVGQPAWRYPDNDSAQSSKVPKDGWPMVMEPTTAVSSHYL